MSNTSKQKRFRWLLALAVLTATSNGCASWNHHVGKHSILSHFHKKHHSPYTQCEDCGQIILNDRYHQCNQCTPKPAFYGFKSTCWNAWPLGWSPCPAPATDGCLINGESVVLHESTPVPDEMPHVSASGAALESNDNNKAVAVATSPLSNDVSASDAEATEDIERSSEADVAQLDNSASIETPSQDKIENPISSIASESDLNSEADVQELGPDLGVDSTNNNGNDNDEEEDPSDQPVESAESEEPSDAESVSSIVEEDVVFIEKTTPAINTSYELPSVSRSIPPVPVTPAPVPVAPASAMVASLAPTELHYSETTPEPVVSASKSRLIDLKHFLKEARSTALHLSQAKKPDGQESEKSLDFNGSQSILSEPSLDQDASEDAVQTEHVTKPIALVVPVSNTVPTAKKVSLLDRLCPKPSN